jgi:hypothetical protein
VSEKKAKATGYGPSDDALVDEVTALVDDGLKKRRTFEVKWRLAHEFYEGNQWLRASDDHKLVNIKWGEKKPKVVINKMLPMVQTRIAHVLKNKPIGYVTPATPDEEDRNAARTADQALEYYYRVLDYERKLAEDAALEMFVAGTVFWKVYWDGDAGPEVEIPQYEKDEEGGIATFPEVEPGMDETGAIVMNPHPQAGQPIPAEPIRRPRGEPALDVVKPDEIIPEAGAKRLSQANRVVHRTLKPLDSLRVAYGDEAVEGLETIDPDSDEMAGLVSAARSSGMTDSEISESVEVWEFWAKPHSVKWPDGLWAVVSNKKVLRKEPTPKGHSHIPFVQMTEIPTKSFWGTSSVIQAMDPQKLLNRNVSRDEYRRTMQRPKLWVPHEAGVDEDQVSNDDSEIVLHTNGYTGEYKAPPAFESDQNAMMLYQNAIDSIGGNWGTLSGDSQSEVRSGRQAFILGEYSGTVLSGPARSIERGVKDIGNLLLKVIKEWVTEERTIQIVGNNRGIEVMHFKGSDIEGAGDYYVEPGSALPRSRAEKEQLIFNLVDRAMIDPIRASKLLSMPTDLDETTAEEQLDRDNATLENEAFRKLALIPPEKLAIVQGMAQEKAMGSANPMDPLSANPVALLLKELKIAPRPEFENNDVHLIRHNHFRKTQDYRNLPEWAQALVDEHCDGHMPMPAPMPMAGPGGEPGGPPGPGVMEQKPFGPSALQPGMSPLMGGATPGNADQAGDLSAGLPPMPQTPSPESTLPA